MRNTLLEQVGAWSIYQAGDGHIFCAADARRDNRPIHEDHPVIVRYADGDTLITYDFPERVPARVKAVIKRILLSGNYATRDYSAIRPNHNGLIGGVEFK